MVYVPIHTQNNNNQLQHTVNTFLKVFENSFKKGQLLTFLLLGQLPLLQQRTWGSPGVSSWVRV
jgi:hypothetical protein